MISSNEPESPSTLTVIAAFLAAAAVASAIAASSAAFRSGFVRLTEQLNHSVNGPGKALRCARRCRW